MKITCLIDNCALDGFRAQHGLSFWIEACGRRILFDTGADGAFIENAARLGIDIAQAEFCVISHGHYDHGQGIPAQGRLRQALCQQAGPGPGIHRP